MNRIALLLVLAIAACKPSSIGAPLDPTDSPDAGGSHNPPPPGDGGTTTPPPPPPPDPCLTALPNPGPAPLRRLTNLEWRYTVTDLLGQASLAETLSRTFVAETESLGFRNNADFLDVGPLIAQQYMDAAEQLAERAGTSLLACDPASPGCVRSFITTFGRKAFRRPLAAEEIDTFEGLFTRTSSVHGAAAGVEWVLFAILQSPHFLYRVELSAPAPGENFVRPSSFEMASRLSYLIWRSMPDETLLAAAERDELQTPEQIEAQARRMVDDPKARRAIDFYEEWLDSDRISAMQRDPQVFAGLPSDLTALFQEETRRFVEHVVWSGGDLQELLSADYTFANDRLAQHYGLSGASGSSFTRVPLDPSRGRGVFAQAGVITVHDKPSRTSIVKRGLKVRTSFLCQSIGAPPDNVVTELPEIGSDLTQRERLEQHRENIACAYCHNFMDPIGVVFEKIDAVGRYREVDEHGIDIDVSSFLDFTADVNGPLTGPADLAEKLSRSSQTEQCFVTQAFRFAYGRGETTADQCSIAALQTRFRENGRSLKELLIALTQTDTFLLRPAQSE